MKVFDTINRRKPCTTEQTERGDETENDCDLAQCATLQYFGHLVGHKAFWLSPDFSFLFQKSKAVASAGLPNAVLVCMCMKAVTQLFPRMTRVFFKLPFTMINSSLLFLSFKKDEAFSVVQMNRKLLPRNQDSFSRLTMAQKSKLKEKTKPNQTKKQTRKFFHQDLTFEYMWMQLHFERKVPKATQRHPRPTEPC